eukprot:scaffold1034_cov127-Cylindrotheca_fusiformis.AAC.15
MNNAGLAVALWAVLAVPFFLMEQTAVVKTVDTDCAGNRVDVRRKQDPTCKIVVGQWNDDN